MIKEAVILAGGFGTRLQEVVKDVPKPMAGINNKPFLEYLFQYLLHYNIKKVVLSVGYKAEIIQNHFKNHFTGIDIEYAYEWEPLGTGGGILNALKFCTTENVLVINGDTFFDINLPELYNFHKANASQVTLCLKDIKDTGRYGKVSLDDHYRITGFIEKEAGEGYINGGVYLMNRSVLESFDLPLKFSFEKDFLEKYYKKLNIFGFVSNSYFIDIGIPEDYQRAQEELDTINTLKNRTVNNLKDLGINKNWTLFLDRDGVINRKIENDYVKKWEEFEFLPGAIHALKLLASLFGRIVIVTNQQGIGKGVFSAEDLKSTHDKMLEMINKEGGRIDKIYFSPALAEENSPLRKPNTGMAHQAKRDFPEISSGRSIIVGDSLSDMVFGKRMSMFTVFISEDPALIKENALMIDYSFKDLASFAEHFSE